MDKITEQVHHPENVGVLQDGIVEIAQLNIQENLLVLVVKTDKDTSYLLRVPLPIRISRIHRVRS